MYVIINNEIEMNEFIRLFKDEYKWRNGKKLEDFSPYKTKMFNLIDNNKVVLKITNKVLDWSINVMDIDEIKRFHDGSDIISIGRLTSE